MYLVILAVFCMQSVVFSGEKENPHTESSESEGRGGYAVGVDSLLARAAKDSQRDSFASDRRRNTKRRRHTIKRTVGAHASDLHDLYNSHLESHPEARGKVVVFWEINEHGTVHNCEIVRSTMNDADFEKTVINIISTWDFGPLDTYGDRT
ncbi:MAG: AgmX/PglI C-terminal domain-containing protein [Fibrobacterota bacterium]